MVKPHLVSVALCFLIGGCTVYSADESIRREQLQFLEKQSQPLLVPDVMKRLGAIEGGKGPYYQYKLRGEKTTVEFWFRPGPRIVPPEGTPVEIAIVVERPTRVRPRIIWPRDLRGTDIEAAKKRFYPNGY
jgi:hypothetical protein